MKEIQNDRELVFERLLNPRGRWYLRSGRILNTLSNGGAQMDSPIPITGWM